MQDCDESFVLWSRSRYHNAMHSGKKTDIFTSASSPTLVLKQSGLRNCIPTPLWMSDDDIGHLSVQYHQACWAWIMQKKRLILLSHGGNRFEKQQDCDGVDDSRRCLRDI